MADRSTQPPLQTRTAVLATIVAAGIAGFSAVYVMAGGPDNGARQRVAQAPTGAAPVLPAGPGTNALSVGQMAAFVFKKAPEAIPDLPFVDKDGKSRLLTEWKGKVVLVNLWATWCAPCRKEMPSLDRLQAELGGATFEVVAISADKTGIEGAKKFLEQINVAKLGLYADPTVRIHSGLKAVGMPASILLDQAGREVGRLVGPAEWDSEEAKTLIRTVIAAGR